MNSMSTHTLESTPTTLEALNMSHTETTGKAPAKKSMTQTWVCSLLSAYLFAQGLWLMEGGTGSDSFAGQFNVLLAVVLWVSVPSLLYYSWKGYRQAHPVSAGKSGQRAGHCWNLTPATGMSQYR